MAGAEPVTIPAYKHECGKAVLYRSHMKITIDVARDDQPPLTQSGDFSCAVTVLARDASGLGQIWW